MQSRILQNVNPLLLFLLSIILLISVVSADPTKADSNEMDLFRRDPDLYKRMCCGSPTDCPTDCGEVCSPNPETSCQLKSLVTDLHSFSASIAIDGRCKTNWRVILMEAFEEETSGGQNHSRQQLS